MKVHSTLAFFGTVFSMASAAIAAAPSGPVFYGDPPDEHHPWAVHDRNRPQPKVITPSTFSSPDKPGRPPSDAVVLFDGADLSKWESAKDGSPAKWLVKDGCMEVARTGDIRTKGKFGDCQLHVEWAAPKEVKGDSQGRGNSGIFLVDRLEIQVLDNYNNPTYADGAAGSYYGINPPLVNALHPPGEYQVYDIIFRRPIYKNGQVLDPGYVTVFMNGVLVQDHTPLEGSGGHMGRTRPGPFPDKGAIRLQDHGNPTRFRNIWVRELPPRPVEGGTDGFLTTEATMAKRREIAASIRQDAPKLQDPANPMAEMQRWLESLVYEKQDAAALKAEQMATQYVRTLKQLPADKLEAKKGEVKYLRDVFKFLTKFNVLPADFGPKVEIDRIILERDWDKKD